MSDEAAQPKYVRCAICEAPNKPNRQGYLTTTYVINRKHYMQVHTAGCPIGWKPESEGTDE